MTGMFDGYAPVPLDVSVNPTSNQVRQMSETNDSYNINWEWVDESRAGSPGFPAYLPTEDWLKAIDVEPALLICCIENWWKVATSAVKQVLACEIPEVPSGFTGLTDLLVLSCDSLRTIDATPLKKLHDAVYAREGVLHDLVTVANWPSLTAIESMLAEALPIRTRIKNLAQTQIEASSEDGSRDDRRKQAFRERISKVRSVLKDSARKDLSRDEIRKALEDEFDCGMNNETMGKVLDVLRKTGEYTVARRPRRKIRNRPG